MLKINHLFFNFILSLYIFFMNYNLLFFVSSKTNSFVFLISIYIIYFLLVFVVINILCFFRILAYFFTFILIITISFISYFVYNYSVIIDSDMIVNAMATDSREISDLFSFNMIIYIFFTCIIPILFLFFVRIKNNKILHKIFIILISIISLFALIFINSKSLIPFLRANDIIRYYNFPFYQYYSFFKVVKLKFKSPEILSEISQDAKMLDDEFSKTFILVVGETARAKNYSLGGYTKNDTNFYTKNLDVNYFTNFTSCGTATAQSLPCMFSKHKRTEFNKNEAYKNVLSVLNRFIDVYWLDNNSGGCKGVCNGIKSTIKSENYDGWLIDDTKQILANKKDKNTLIVVHIQGSHGPAYYLRYPNEFAKFQPICNTNKLQDCSQEALINTYDNTLLYTDFLVANLIKILQNDKADKKVLFYLSDHGESLGENGFYLHGMPYYLAPKEQIHIPAILWQNEEYINKDKLNLELSQDNLFSSLLGFFNITTKDYDSEYDIFNAKLNKNK